LRAFHYNYCNETSVSNIAYKFFLLRIAGIF
jgi:hypothetical protein